MKHTNELIRILNEELNGNKARISCFVLMLMALVAVQTVNLTKLACFFASDSKISSRYRRMPRFLLNFR